MSKYLLEPGTCADGLGCLLPRMYLGCIAVDDTESEGVQRMLSKEALQGLGLDWPCCEDGDPIPPPAAETDTVTIALAGQSPRRYLTILQPTLIGGWSVSAADVPDLVLEFSTRAGSPAPAP